MRLHEGIHKHQIQRFTALNLERHVSLLRDFVALSLAIPALKIDGQMVRQLHAHATVGLVDEPGEYRDHDNWMRTTGFHPPAFTNVPMLMGEFYPELHKRWDETPDPYTLAAFALWKLCWIHPFEDGNGRTARAVAYHIICVKMGGWLPGKQTLLERIKLDRGEYANALRHADDSFKQGAVDLLPMAALLSRHTLEQLSS